MGREHIAAALKRLRMATGLKADDVGAMIGKSGKTVNAWENNRGQPDADTLVLLCDIYHVDNILDEFSDKKEKGPSKSDELIKAVDALSDDNLIKLEEYIDFLLLQQQRKG